MYFTTSSSPCPLNTKWLWRIYRPDSGFATYPVSALYREEHSAGIVPPTPLAGWRTARGRLGPEHTFWAGRPCRADPEGVWPLHSGQPLLPCGFVAGPSAHTHLGVSGVCTVTLCSSRCTTARGLGHQCGPLGHMSTRF